jgi:hypothetical protein
VGRRDNTEQLGTLIQRWMAPMHRDPVFRRAVVRAAWDDLLGPAVAARTQRMEWHGTELLVVLDSSAMRHELDLQKTKIAESLREVLGDAYPLEGIRFA